MGTGAGQGSREQSTAAAVDLETGLRVAVGADREEELRASSIGHCYSHIVVYYIANLCDLLVLIR